MLQPDNHTILAVAGPSGVGKSSVSYQLARRLDCPLVELDDIFHAIEAVTTPESHPWIHFWQNHPDPDGPPDEEIIRLHIEVCRAMTPAIAAVIENHIETKRPVIIEGDYLLPELAAKHRQEMSTVYLIDDNVDQYVANFLAREPGAGEQRRRAEASLAFGEWLQRECETHRLAMVPSRPWKSVVERVMGLFT